MQNLNKNSLCISHLNLEVFDDLRKKIEKDSFSVTGLVIPPYFYELIALRGIPLHLHDDGSFSIYSNPKFAGLKWTLDPYLDPHRFKIEAFSDFMDFKEFVVSYRDADPFIDEFIIPVHKSEPLSPYSVSETLPLGKIQKTINAFCYGEYSMQDGDLLHHSHPIGVSLKHSYKYIDISPSERLTLKSYPAIFIRTPEGELFILKQKADKILSLIFPLNVTLAEVLPLLSIAPLHIPS